MKTISICIPTWERVEMTIDSFSNVYNDERVSNIIIVDDASSIETYNKLKLYCDTLPKVKLIRNLTNQNCYLNKYISVSYCPTDYCVLFDSDNILDTNYIDSIYEHEWDSKTIFAPVWAMPTFDYREFEGITIDKTNVALFVDKPLFTTALNTCNFFVNKDEYLVDFDKQIDPNTSDSIFMNTKWLEKGNKIFFVPNLTYQHTIHSGSHYQQNAYKGDLNEKMVEKLRNMK